MKASLVIAICFLACNLSYSQKLLYKVDKLTGDTTVYVGRFYLEGKSGIMAEYKPSLSFVILNVSGSKSIGIYGAYKGKFITRLNQGDSISFKLKSGKIISLIYGDQTMTDYSVSSNADVTYFQQIVLLDDENIDELTLEPVVFIRVGTEERNLDYEIDVKRQELLMNNLKLFKSK